MRDEPTYKDHSHQETSDGHVVRGSYRVALPDGRVQVVNYRADRNGYVADVTYEGNINYAPGYSPYAASNHPAPPHFNQKPAGASSAPANEHLQEKSSNLHWRNDAEASEAPEEVKSSDMQISQLVPQVNSTEVESEVAKIFPVDEPVSTETPATVNEPVNEPRIRPIKLSLPKPSSEIVPPVPITRIRPIKLAYTKPLQIAKSVAKPDSLVTPRIRPIKLNFPKPIDQATKSDDQTDDVQVSRSKSALPKLALKRPFPKPVVEQPSRPKATDGNFYLKFYSILFWWNHFEFRYFETDLPEAVIPEIGSNIRHFAPETVVSASLAAENFCGFDCSIKSEEIFDPEAGIKARVPKD